MDDFNRAILLYTGWRLHPSPRADGDRVINGFGQAKGADLLKRVRSLTEELNASKPDWSVHDLASGSEWAVKQLAARHPELNEEALSALGWSLAYGWK